MFLPSTGLCGHYNGVSFSLHALALLLPHTFSQASDSELVFAPRLVRWFAGLLSFSFDGASLQARVCTITAGPEYVPKTTCISQRTTFRASLVIDFIDGAFET